MNGKLLNVAFVSLLLSFGCEKEKVQPINEGGPPLAIDYLVFGHVGSFCMNCDEVYKIQDGKLYGANHQFITNPDSVALQLLPNSSYELAKGLTTTIPSQLFTESSSNIGTYFPDVGHYYIEMSRGHQVKHWYMEAGAPQYLTNFLKDVNEVMMELN